MGGVVVNLLDSFLTGRRSIYYSVRYDDETTNTRLPETVMDFTPQFIQKEEQYELQKQHNEEQFINARAILNTVDFIRFKKNDKFLNFRLNKVGTVSNVTKSDRSKYSVKYDDETEYTIAPQSDMERIPLSVEEQNANERKFSREDIVFYVNERIKGIITYKLQNGNFNIFLDNKNEISVVSSDNLVHIYITDSHDDIVNRGRKRYEINHQITEQSTQEKDDLIQQLQKLRTEKKESENKLEQLNKRLTCPVCMTNNSDMVFGCGHLICSECLPKMAYNGKQCPICRNVSNINPQSIYYKKYLKYKNKYLSLINFK